MWELVFDDSWFYFRTYPYFETITRIQLMSRFRKYPGFETITGFQLITHRWPFSKSKFILKSDRVNLVAPASPVHRYSKNWDRKGWPSSEIQMYYGCPCKGLYAYFQVTLWGKEGNVHLQRYPLNIWLFIADAYIGISTQLMFYFKNLKINIYLFCDL